MTEIILIFLVALLLFGAKRLPEIGSSLGKGIREFKGSLRDIENELRVDDDTGRNRSAPRRPASTESETSPRRLTSSESRPEASVPDAAPEREPSSASRSASAGSTDTTDEEPS